MGAQRHFCRRLPGLRDSRKETFGSSIWQLVPSDRMNPTEQFQHDRTGYSSDSLDITAHRGSVCTGDREQKT